MLPEDATSPTVSVETLLLTCVIDAMAEHKVTTADISRVSLQTEIDEDVIIVFEGQMVDLLIITDPSYEEFVHIYSSSKKTIYVQLQKEMY